MEMIKHLDCLNLTSAVLIGFLFLFCSEILRLIFPRYKTPPGPVPFPFLGSLPQFIKAPTETMEQMKAYGEMSSIYIGRQLFVILNTLDVVKEALVENASEFAGRPLVPVFEWIIGGLGIIMAPYGNVWRQQRRFAMQTLRNFGLGKKSLEERIVEEAKHLTEELEKQGGKAFDPHHCIQNAVSNIICSIVFGNRFEYEDKRFAYFLGIIHENMVLAGSVIAQIFNIFPFIKHFPGPHQKIKRNSDELKAFVRESVKEHYNTLDKEHLRDFIDAYITEIEKQKMNPESTFFEENMILSILDLFVAGTDTTSNTIQWGLTFLMENPDIQDKCRHEIAQVIGSDRPPTMEDRARMPYVNATLHEIQRMANLSPLGVMHAVTKETQLRGYKLPKDTAIIINFSALLTDNNHWKYPNTFNPENFLNEKGEFCKNEAFIPFSLGLRICPGEKLAKMELFIFFTSLLQHLKFSWPPGSDVYDTEGVLGLVRSPKPYKMVCENRATKA